MILLTDIHGNFDTMMALLDMIPKKEKDKGIVICGDLVDRGPKSRQIVQWCIDNNIQCVKGNHEKMVIDEFKDTVSYIRKNGYPPMGGYTYETYCSYESYDEDNLDERGLPTRSFDMATFIEHVEWMKKLPLYIEFPNIKNEDGRYLVISHSYIGNVWKMRNDNDRIFEAQVLWGRPNKFKNVPEIFNVFGHTIQDWGARIRTGFANIDTGCFYTEDSANGRLTALQFPEMILYEHSNIDTKVGSEPIKSVLTPEDIKERKKRNKRRR